MLCINLIENGLQIENGKYVDYQGNSRMNSHLVTRINNFGDSTHTPVTNVMNTTANFGVLRHSRHQ